MDGIPHLDKQNMDVGTHDSPQSRHSSAPLILIFGMPRSGTTWIGKIFDSHPSTFYRHEPDSWGLLNRIPLFIASRDYERCADELRAFISGLPDMTATKVNASFPIFPKHYYSGLRLQARRSTAYIAKVGARLFGEFPSPAFIPAEQAHSVPIVWKSIESLGRLGAVLSVAHGARAILVVRHPCGYVASVLRGERSGSFSGSTPSSDDYGIFQKLLDTPLAQARGLTIARLQAMTPVERLAWRWLLYNDKAMADVQDRSDVMILRYEDLCGNPIERAQAMLSFAGLQWDAQTEFFIRSSTSNEDEAYYSLSRDPAKAATKWRQQLSPEDHRSVMAIVNDSAPGLLYSDDPSFEPIATAEA